MEKPLISDKRFWPMFWTQFLGAFNDNLFKNALVILITFQSYSIGGIAVPQMVALCGGIFILPFFLFSALAGQLADRYSKSRLIFWIKVWEILVMFIGAYGFVYKNLPILLTTLFMMGMQSSFFGPVKYSILPHLLNDKELISGNAYVETGTFISVLLGTIVGGLLIAIPNSGSWMVSITAIVISILGCVFSLNIQWIGPVDKKLKININPLIPTIKVLKLTKKVRSIFLSILGISWFWFLGAAFLSILPPYCKSFLGGDETLVTFFLALFSIGVGAGSIICKRLSYQKTELGLVPIGSFGISLFTFDLFLIGFPELLAPMSGAKLSFYDFLSTIVGWRVSFDFFFFSMFSGIFILPLYTLIQQRSEKKVRSRVIAGNNIINALFMVISALFLVVLFSFEISIPVIFLIISVLNICVAVYIYTVIPEFLFRFICWVIANIMYRLKVFGRDNIPEKGAAVLVCNHVSLVDWLIIASACQRPIRFVMHYGFINIPFTKRIFKDAKVIPIAGLKESRTQLNQAFLRIKNELENGELVCIFPEGKLTSDGEMGTFKTGIERIVRTTPVPVIPLFLDGLWGSFFSRKHGKAMIKPFKRIWSKISLVIGPAILPDKKVSAAQLQEILKQLSSSKKVPWA